MHRIVFRTINMYSSVLKRYLIGMQSNPSLMELINKDLLGLLVKFSSPARYAFHSGVTYETTFRIQGILPKRFSCRSNNINALHDVNTIKINHHVFHAAVILTATLNF